MPTLSADQARQLAADFHDLAFALGQYRFDNWDDLSAAQRAKLGDLQWTLLNYSSDFTLQAMKITLQDVDATLQKIKGATDLAQAAIKKIQAVNKIFKVAVAGTVLGAAIVTGNATGIASALQGVADAVSS